MKRQKKHIYFSWIITLVILFQQIAFLPLHQIVEGVHNNLEIAESSFEIESNNSGDQLILTHFENDHCNLCDYFFSQVSFINSLKINDLKDLNYQPESFYTYCFASNQTIKDKSRAPPVNLFS
ncbi:MAG: hypothetical protein KTR26_22355 [Flammeovirgaceae bacterium]|nr:hypothetical protein [Flammeovirgaceae bacterium]